MKIDSRDVALTAVLAALYGMLVIFQGLSAAATVQLRIADVLIPLSALFGWPAVFGVTVGAFVGNAFTSAALPNGVYDVALGPLANLIAATTIYLLRKKRLAGCVAGSAVIGLIVGSYVWMIFGTPSDFFGLGLPSAWPVWIASIAFITMSSLVAIAVIGYLLSKVLDRPNIIGPLKSRGLRVTSEEKDR